MIVAEGVTRRFGSVTAVDQVSFALKVDQIIGFVGPNGAGKSTLMRMIATYLLPSAGRLTVAGLDVTRHPLEVRRRLGYLPGDTPLYQGMRADRFLGFVADAHGLRGKARDARLRYVVERCGLEEALEKRVLECSTGYRKRLGLAAALVHDPEVILLDEPTHGLDPVQVRGFRDLLRDLRPGRVILLSSHVISEVATVCDRLLLIREGKLLADGNIAALCEEEGLATHQLEELFLRRVARNGDEEAP